MSEPRRIQELRKKFRMPEPEPEPIYGNDPGNFWEHGRREKFNVGDEVYVRCKVVGPPLLAYGEDCIVLDLVVVDSNGEATGSKFTTTPSEAFWPYELMPRA